MSQYPLVTKADGEQEPFDPEKLDLSLKRAGADAKVRDEILKHISETIEDGITTEEIYRHAFTLLNRKDELPVAARYSIKRAVFALGPSGFPFEQFFAQVLNAHGWKTATGVALSGKCAPHEVDIVAVKDGRRVGIEAKFHNSAGIKTDVKDALYVHARFEDLKVARSERDRLDDGWLVTNTRFTRTAVRYAHCVGLSLVGWDYPRRMNMLEMIESAQVHPLTALTTLTENEKRALLDRNIVLCRTVGSSRNILEEYGVAPDRVPAVFDEARQLCGI